MATRFYITAGHRRKIKMVLLVDGLIYITSTVCIYSDERKKVASAYPNSQVTLALPNTWEIHPDSPILQPQPAGFTTMYPAFEEISDEEAAV